MFDENKLGDERDGVEGVSEDAFGESNDGRNHFKEILLSF